MFLIDFILHIDTHIYAMANTVGNWTYLLLFLVIFVETGAVIFPFLPGDSLLFAAGALAANPKMSFNIVTFLIIFFIAAFIGDSCNFLIGRTFGYRFIKHPFFRRFIKEKNIRDAELYFEKKGTAAIILGRYIPIIRTFVPFVAGIIATGSGFLFGNIPFVKQHFSLIILGIVFVTLIPVLISGVKSYRNTK